MRFWGYRDQVAPGGPVIADQASVNAELRRAYDRGRRDERLRHHRSPLLTLILLIAAAIGAVLVFYAAREGSFAGGGGVVDNKLDGASAQIVRPAVTSAETQAGTALQQAGEGLKDKGAALRNSASGTASR